MSATGSYFEEQRGNGEEHGSKPSDSQKGGGFHGLYVIGTFLACGFLITFGWGGISASLVSVARTKLGRLPQRTRGPIDYKEEVERSKDVSTSMSDLLPPILTEGKGVATWSIRDERRRVEWPRRGPFW
jgi:hypothetical protein